MPDREPPQPFKIMKPRNSGRVQLCFAENDALRAERQILFATIDQLKEENVHIKHCENCGSKENCEALIFGMESELLEVEIERDQLKEENATLRENQRPEGGVAACDRIERERDELARKVSDLHTALDTQGETLYLVTQERDTLKKTVNLQSSINNILMIDCTIYKDALGEIERTCDGLAHGIASRTLHPVPHSTDA